MPWIIFLIFFWASLSESPVWAIMMNGGYDTTPPTSTQIPHWTTGWGNDSVTGWNYVGYVDGVVNGQNVVASGVYLGNGFVLTAAHIGIGNFVLAGVYYTPIASSAQSFSVTGKPNEPVDLCLFQIASPPDLPALNISQTLPSVGSQVVMLGTGGDSGLTWGYDKVTAVSYFPNPPVVFNDVTYYSANILADFTGTNTSIVVTGDSGGGDFVYNTSTSKWELAGINEYSATYTNGTQTSAFVQLRNYAWVITNVMNQAISDRTDTPTMPLAGLVVLGGTLFVAASCCLGVKSATNNQKE